jgi:hypothetical protein
VRRRSLSQACARTWRAAPRAAIRTLQRRRRPRRAAHIDASKSESCAALCRPCVRGSLQRVFTRRAHAVRRARRSSGPAAAAAGMPRRAAASKPRCPSSASLHASRAHHATMPAMCSENAGSGSGGLGALATNAAIQSVRSQHVHRRAAV